MIQTLRHLIFKLVMFNKVLIIIIEIKKIFQNRTRMRLNFLFNFLNFLLLLLIFLRQASSSFNSSIHVYIEDELIKILRNIYYPKVMRNLSITKIKDINTSFELCTVAVRNFTVEIPVEQMQKTQKLSLQLDRNNQKIIVIVQDFIVKTSADVKVFCYPLIGSRNAGFEGTVVFKRITIILSPEEKQRQSDGFFFPTFNVDSIDIESLPVHSNLYIQGVSNLLTEFINIQILKPGLTRVVKDFKGDVNNALQKTLNEIVQKTRLYNQIDDTGVLLIYSGAGKLQIYDNYLRMGVFMTFAVKPNPLDFIQQKPYIPPSYTQKFSQHSSYDLNNAKIVLSDYLFDAFAFACQRSNNCFIEITNKFLQERNINNILNTYQLFFISKEIDIKKEESRDLIMSVKLVQNQQRKSLRFTQSAILGQVDLILTFLYQDTRQLVIQFKAGINIQANISSLDGDEQKMGYLQISDFELKLDYLELLRSGIGQVDDQEIERYRKVTSTIFFIGKPIFNDLVFNRKLPMAKKMIDLIEFKELKLLFVDQVAILSTTIQN